MAIGPCEFITCRSSIGSTFRGPVHFIEGGARLVEVSICPEHERICRPIRDGTAGGKLMMTAEGWVYPSVWMDSISFYRFPGI